MKEKYLSMAQAAEICPYEKGYLSLLARRKELKAVKVGGNWHTTVEWLNEYLRQKKPGHLIDTEEKKEEKINPWLTPKYAVASLFVLILIVGLATFLFNAIFNNLRDNGENQNAFVPEEIIKVPNEDGGYDIYGAGRVKLGEEEVRENQGEIGVP